MEVKTIAHETNNERKGDECAGRYFYLSDCRVLRHQHRLHVRVWKALSHGKHTGWTRFSGPADLPVCGHAQAGKVLKF